MKFNGSDYIHKVDSVRLSRQHVRIKLCMGDGIWRTLQEIARYTGDPEASISAQLRHLRKPRFGSWVVEKRPRKERSKGLFEYRLMPTGHTSEYVVTPKRNKLKEALELVWKHKDCSESMRQEIKGVFE